MTISKPGAQPGYMIYGAPDGNAYAIDIKGAVAMKWTAPEGFGRLAYTRPLDNGNLLARTQTNAPTTQPGTYAENASSWELPIHRLMSKFGVTIFFHGHDHVFVRQELDGVVYQETPSPANPNYGDRFREVYRYGDFLPSSGHLRVSVGPENVKVDYVRSWMAQDVSAERRQGEVAFSYTARSRTHADGMRQAYNAPGVSGGHSLAT